MILMLTFLLKIHTLTTETNEILINEINGRL